MEATEYRVLNLGAGVQSTALYIMAMNGEIQPIDVAVFADVQEEPQAVYDHLNWLRSLGGPEIVTVTNGRLGDDLNRISIPCFVANLDGTAGILRRQCTSDFKVEPIEKFIRERFGDGFGKPIPKHVTITQLMGLSFDEPKRVIRVQQRFAAKPKNWLVEFPLWNEQMTRADCVQYLRDIVPHETPRSACVFCPYKSDAEWRLLRDTDQDGWRRAVEIDHQCRVRHGLNGQRFVHRSLVPLDAVDFRGKDEKRGQLHLGFIDECEGYCGN